MNFELAFEKYKNGTATEEEKAYVESEIAKARKLSEIIDSMDANRVVESAEPAVVKKAIRKANKKSALRTAIISSIVVISLAVITALSLLIYVSATASGKADFGKEKCIAAAKEAVMEHVGDSTKELVVTDTERDLYLEYGTLSSAIYIYEIEIRCGYTEYEIRVDSRTGKATIIDIDN